MCQAGIFHVPVRVLPSFSSLAPPSLPLQAAAPLPFLFQAHIHPQPLLLAQHVLQHPGGLPWSPFFYWGAQTGTAPHCQCTWELFLEEGCFSLGFAFPKPPSGHFGKCRWVVCALPRPCCLPRASLLTAGQEGKVLCSPPVA